MMIIKMTIIIIIIIIIIITMIIIIKIATNQSHYIFSVNVLKVNIFHIFTWIIRQLSRFHLKEIKKFDAFKFTQTWIAKEM